MRYLYNILFYLALPFIVLRLLWRSRQSPAYRQRISERFGFIDYVANNKPIWIHAVSLGEAKLATLLAENLKINYPEIPLVITTMTVTGSEQVRNTLNTTVFHCYLPYDYPNAIKLFLKKIQPRLLILMETELWPNLLYYCGQYKIPIMIANARLAENSAKGYQRLRLFMQPLLQSVTQVLAQTAADAQRFIDIGFKKERVDVVGNIKFDVPLPKKMAKTKILKEQLGSERPTWIAASTHRGEDEIILEAFAALKQKLPNALLILVPRHPERFNEVAKLCEQKKFLFTRHSNPKKLISETTDIYLGDTIGELGLFYTLADAAFVGGSLIPHGGHNLLEPAALGLPVLTGPHTVNFQQIVALLQEANALHLVKNAAELSATVLKLLEDDNWRKQEGQKTQKVVVQNQGALSKHLQQIAIHGALAN